MIRHRWHKARIVFVVLDSELRFGKHTGKTIKWVIDNDLQYIEWCLREGIIKYESQAAEKYYNYNLIKNK
jgi:hypothetical protein